MIGVGLLFGGIALVHGIGMIVSGHFTVVAIVNLLTTLPFTAVLIGGGYWLLQSEIPTERFTRIAIWISTGFVFLGGFFLLIAIFNADHFSAFVGISMWGMTVGAGAGALVGIFEAKSINKAVLSERTRIQNEQLKKQSERLEEFASIVSHDLRSPHSVATGNLELVREDCDSEKIDAISSALARMDAIITDTLTLAKLGQVVGETEPVEIGSLVESCWEMVQTDGAKLQITDIGRVEADPDRLRHVFENLIRNAIEHGGNSVTVRIGRLRDGSGFYLEDDGPGISDEDLESIFETGQSSEDGQTGFGLAIVQRTTEAHGWDIEAANGAGGGARFEITGIEWVEN